MNKEMLEHYKKFSLFTFPGAYKEKLASELPDDIREIGNLVRNAFIHRTTLEDWRVKRKRDLKYGDISKIPWWQQAQDDYLVTAGAMLTELYRKDPKGFIKDKKAEDKLILTCRFVAIIVASILKSKDIPCRVRSGFAPYFKDYTGDTNSWDHWINQYWKESESRWVTIDVDGCKHPLSFDPSDILEGEFDFAADAYLAVREGKISPDHFCNAGGSKGIYPLVWELIYDLHCLMNSEIIYLHGPEFVLFVNYLQGKPLKEEDLVDLDKLARLMKNPDKNFDKLESIWGSSKKFRLLKGALL